MPTRERLSEFVATVVAGRYIEAIEGFYAENASMRENQAEPRVGRGVLVGHERAVLSTLKQMRTRAAHVSILDGECVAINWEFEMIGVEGRVRTLNEVALQVWSGDRILHEQFYYDPGQLR
jgi:hypothetical protein